MRSFVDQLLEKRPLDRFKTAQEALDALLEFKADMGGLGQVADGPVTVRGCHNIDTSYPAFADDLARVGGALERHV